MRWLDLGLADELSSARCPPSRAVELAARELAPLVEQWLELARGGGSTLWGKPRAASAGGGGDGGAEAAVGRMLASLGPMPPPERPSERAIGPAIKRLVVRSSVGPIERLIKHDPHTSRHR